MDKEYKYTFNNLKTELKGLDTEQLNLKLKEQQQELFRCNAALFTGSKRVIYGENKFNIKKLHRIIAVIRNMIKCKEVKDGHNKLVKNS